MRFLETTDVIQIERIDTTVLASMGYFDAFQEGNTAFESGKYSEAATNFLSSVAIAQEYGRPDLELDACDRLSQCYFRQYQFETMLKFATQTLELCKQVDNEKKRVTALNRIGIAYGSFGVNEEALDYFLKALELAERLDHSDLPMILNNISMIYSNLGNVEGALMYLEKSLQLSIKHSDILNHVICLSNFGEQYIGIGRYDEAMTSLYEAQLLAKKLKEPNIIIVSIYENLGTCLYSQGKIALAAKCFRKGLIELKKWPENHMNATLLMKFSKVQIEEKKFERALPNLNIAFAYAERSNSLTTQFEIHQVLSNVYKTLGNFQKALQHFEDYHNLRELVHNEDANNRLQGMMVKFDVERVQKEKELAEKEQELAELKYVELAQLNERLEEQSRLDALTKISNRGYLDDFLANEYMKAVRLSRPISVMMCDVDYFKKINDGYSHAVGDDVLRALAKLLKDNLRKDDLVARYGGEEFVVVFPQTQFEQAVKVAEKLRKIVEAYPWEGITDGLSVTMSAGVASGTEYQSYEKLLAQADLKLYEAKDAGRNQVKH